MLFLLRLRVTLTLSSLKTSFSGGGKKSSIIFICPRDSSVYSFIIFFIYLPSFPPISSTKNADNIFTVCKTYRHYFISYLTKTIISFFIITMFNIFSNNTVFISKSILCYLELNSMLILINFILILIPIKMYFFHIIIYNINDLKAIQKYVLLYGYVFFLHTIHKGSTY